VDGIGPMSTRSQVRSSAVLLYGIGIVLSLVLGGCSPNRSGLVGTWRADYAMGFELLTLNQDGSYSQDVRIRDERGVERAVSRKGIWTYQTEGAAAVLLRDCLSPVDGTGELNRGFEFNHGNCLVPVEREWLISSRLRLGSTEASPYRKIS